MFFYHQRFQSLLFSINIHWIYAYVEFTFQLICIFVEKYFFTSNALLAWIPFFFLICKFFPWRWEKYINFLSLENIFSSIIYVLCIDYFQTLTIDRFINCVGMKCSNLPPDWTACKINVHPSEITIMYVHMYQRACVYMASIICNKLGTQCWSNCSIQWSMVLIL